MTNVSPGVNYYPLSIISQRGTIQYTYCILGREEINTWRARGAAARVSVNFRKFSPCIARARGARAGLTVYPLSWTLELLNFDEYCRFDTSAFL